MHTTKQYELGGPLGKAGVASPVFIDSGNGYYLLYKINLPTDKKGLVERCLKALAAKYDDDNTEIDPRVFNPGRIAKIPGTLSRKGDPTPDRPHRQSSVVSVPEVWSCVPTERLEACPQPRPRRNRPTPPENPAHQQSLATGLPANTTTS